MSDLIDRQAAIDGFYEMASDTDHLCTVGDYVKFLESMTSAQSDSSFITWLLDEIWDENMWELNCGAFPEIVCRKLTKLGYVRERNGEYERLD